jgi:hypothetical protein
VRAPFFSGQTMEGSRCCIDDDKSICPRFHASQQPPLCALCSSPMLR